MKIRKYNFNNTTLNNFELFLFTLKTNIEVNFQIKDGRITLIFDNLLKNLNKRNK